jgi:hypothetical protein
MRLRNKGNSLDPFFLKNAQIRQPPMEAEQRIVVGGHILRQGVLDEGVIEHPTHRNVSTRNAKTDDPWLLFVIGVPRSVSLPFQGSLLWCYPRLVTTTCVTFGEGTYSVHQ